jgi:putative membrane protein
MKAGVTEAALTAAETRRRRLCGVLLVIVSAALVLSAIKPHDALTWLLEVLPVLIAVPLMIATYRRFPLTPLLYVLIALHALVLIVGGHYTYARVPLGFWMQDWFGFTRNNYDKIGHFAQGFIPAIAAREVLIRVFALPSKKLVAFLCVAICLAVSACYELIEWGAALALGQGADEFLGTQGDIWDTQSDMFLALIGSISALLLLSRWHDRQIQTKKATSA